MPHLIASNWPNSLDAAATTTFLALALLLPALGYVFMVIDLRAYFRSFNRSLICIGRYVGGIPYWARQGTPRAISALGLRLPCTEEDLKHAYRQRVKQLHPDHGGDQRRFLRLQADFEEAIGLIASIRRDECEGWPAARQAI